MRRNGCLRHAPMYHVSVHSAAERVLSLIRRQELLRAGDRVGVAVSGGIDSVALLRLLLELRSQLGIVLSVVHFNHQLRGAESDADERFVATLARERDLEFHGDRDNVAEHAAEEHVSLEAAARELRYGFFRHLLSADGTVDPQGLNPSASGQPNGTAEAVPLHHPASLGSAQPGLGTSGAPGSHPGTPRTGRLDKVVTGHTLDDQAETVLMRMIRGTGLRGLGGIHPRILVDDDDRESCGEIVRPLLGVRRRELESYLNDIGQCWREDSTNTDTALTRNRVRQLVVPLLEKEFNRAVAENLAELADIAREEEDYWDNEVSGWMGSAVHWSEPEWAQDSSPRWALVQIGSMDPGTTPVSHSGSSTPPEDLRSKIEAAPWLVMNASVSRLWLLSEPIAVQRRLVKAIGEYAGIPLEFKHVEEVLRFSVAGNASGKEFSLPLGWKVAWEPAELVFLTPDLREPTEPQDYEYELLVPGQTIAAEAGVAFEARRIPAGGAAEYNPDHLLDAQSLPGPLRVRNWRPGDRFWPSHTKSPKKIKELLQERQIAPVRRQSWPVVVGADEIVWLRGFPVPERFRAKPGREALLIHEQPWAGISEM
jgi:tRNA(Ile)-lysidine synthase